MEVPVNPIFISLHRYSVRALADIFIHSNIACVRQWSGMEAVAVWSLDIEAGCWDMKCHLSGGEGVWVSVWGWEILAIAGSTHVSWRGPGLFKSLLHLVTLSSYWETSTLTWTVTPEGGDWEEWPDPNQIRVLFLASVQITVCSYRTLFLNIRVPIHMVPGHRRLMVSCLIVLSDFWSIQNIRMKRGLEPSTDHRLVMSRIRWWGRILNLARLNVPGRGSALGIPQLECWQQSEGGWYWVYIDHILHLHCWGCGKDVIACCGGNPWTKWWTEEVRVNLKLKKNFYWAYYTVGSGRLPADQEKAARAVTGAKTSWEETFSLFWSNSGKRVVQEGKAEHYLQCVVGVGAADLNSWCSQALQGIL